MVPRGWPQDTKPIGSHICHLVPIYHLNLSQNKNAKLAHSKKQPQVELDQTGPVAVKSQLQILQIIIIIGAS